MCCSIHTLSLELSGWLWSLKNTSVKLDKRTDKTSDRSLSDGCGDVFIYLFLIVSQQTYFPRVGCQNSILMSILIYIHIILFVTAMCSIVKYSFRKTLSNMFG